MCESCRQWDHSSTVTKRQLAAGDANLCLLFRCVCKISSEYGLRNLRKRTKLCSPIAPNLLNHMLDQRDKLEDELGIGFCVERSRWKGGVRGFNETP